MAKEKDFQSEFTNAISYYFYSNKIECVYGKIPDLGVTNLYDCYLRFKGKHYGFELKMTKENTRKKTINFKALFGYGKQEHEIANLEKEIICGFYGYLVINHFIPRKINNVYFLHASYAREFYERGVITIDELERCSTRIYEIEKPIVGSSRKEKVWDIKTFLE